MKARILLTMAALSVFLYGEAAAQKKRQPEEGTFTQWRGLIDNIDIRKTFSINDYSTIYILPIDASEIPLPDKEDNTYGPTVATLENAAVLSAGYMRKPFKKSEITISATDGTETPQEKKALIVEMKLNELDAGNRALRIWVGFGAGNAGTTLSGNIIDAETGDILVSFKHRRIAPLNPSSHEKVLKTLLREVNEDVAKMLLQFQ